MYDVFYNILQPYLKDLQLHYMDTDSFALSYSEGKVIDEHMDLSNLDCPIKTYNKVQGKFKHELGKKVIEDFTALSPKTHSFKDYPKSTKEKGIKNRNNAKHKEYYNALMYNTERSVDECRIQIIGDNITTTKTSKISLNTFDDKRFYVNNIKSYLHDENLYLFKRDLVNKICGAGSLIKDVSLDGDKDLLVNNVLELTINDDRKLIEAAIRLYNDLIKMTNLDRLIELYKLQKVNRRNRLEDKLKQKEYYGKIEELFDPLTKTLNTNAETMQALQNKTLAVLDSNTNTLKCLGHHQQSSFLDERAALLTLTPDPHTTLKYDRGQTFAADNDMIDILLLMGKQTYKQFQLKSVDPNSNKFKINDVDISLVPDGIKMKGKVYDFSKGFSIIIINKDVTKRDIKGDEIKIKQFLRDIGYKQRGILKVIDQNL